MTTQPRPYQRVAEAVAARAAARKVTCPCFRCATERQASGLRSYAVDWRGVPFAERAR